MQKEICKRILLLHGDLASEYMTNPLRIHLLRFIISPLPAENLRVWESSKGPWASRDPPTRSFCYVLAHIRMKYYNHHRCTNFIKMKKYHIDAIAQDPWPISCSSSCDSHKHQPPYLSSYYNLSLHPPSTPPPRAPCLVMRPRWCLAISTFLPFIIPGESESSQWVLIYWQGLCTPTLYIGCRERNRNNICGLINLWRRFLLARRHVVQEITINS